MSETSRGPAVFAPLPGAPAIIDPGWQPAPVPAAPSRWSIAALAGLGTAIILAVWAASAATLFLLDAWTRSPPIAGVATAGFALGAGLIALAIGRDTATIRRLHRVDHLRRLLADDTTDIATARAATAAWIDALPAIADPAGLHNALAQAATTSELRAILRDRVSPGLTAATDQAGLAAALRGGALVAIAPHPSLDSLVIAFVGLRLIRDVATSHGMRPGGTALLSLLRRVGTTVLATAGTDLLAQTLSDQALQELPILRHIAASVPGAGIAALRLRRLARATSAACVPF